jgi:hypothetical protein
MEPCLKLPLQWRASFCLSTTLQKLNPSDNEALTKSHLSAMLPTVYNSTVAVGE